MFGKIIFVVIVKHEVIGILAIKSLEKCGRNVFYIVLPTDGYETLKIGLS